MGDRPGFQWKTHTHMCSNPTIPPPYKQLMDIVAGLKDHK